MPTSEAQKKAVKKWDSTRDKILIRPDKETGAAIRAAAAEAGQSNQQFILQATRGTSSRPRSGRIRKKYSAQKKQNKRFRDLPKTKKRQAAGSVPDRLALFVGVGFCVGFAISRENGRKSKDSQKLPEKNKRGRKHKVSCLFCWS